MIKNIEEFKNTYVKNTPELRDAFLGIALHFGLIDSASDIGQSNGDAVVAYWHDVDGDFFNVGCWFAYADRIKEECRELTLSDLKPRTSTEYEKVTESIFDLRDEFERGELYMKLSGELLPVPNETQLSILLDHKQCYRKIEKEIDWRDGIYEWQHTKKIGIYTPLDFTVAHLISAHPDKFLELCRVALRANGEIE